MVRFRCSECDDFDMCESCHDAVAHSHHMWREVSPTDRVNTGPSTASLLLATMANYRNRWCLGTKRGGEWAWTTYAELYERVAAFATGLRLHCNVQPRARVGICGANCEAWIVADLSLMSLYCMSVPLDPTASDADLRFMIERSELTAIVCSAGVADRLSAIAANCPRLVLLIVGTFEDESTSVEHDCADDDHNDDIVTAASTSSPSDAPCTTTGLATPSDVPNTTPPIRVIDFASVQHAGYDAIQRDPAVFIDMVAEDSREVDSDAVITVIFSSGSTGRPKGIQLSDKTLRKRISNIVFPPNPCVVVAYMPLCHSFERMNVLSHMVVGGRVAFHTGSPSSVLSTCQEVRPTTFSSTPRLWNVLHSDRRP